MFLDWQNLAASGAVLLAALYIGHRAWLQFMPSMRCSQCSGCSEAHSPDKPNGVVVPISLPSRQAVSPK